MLTGNVKALAVALECGQIDGAHHKAWVIDQMVRALTQCPMVMVSAVDCNGVPYEYDTQGESEAYKNFVLKHGSWDTGIAP